jgi:CBS domain containing-hemolysin-like protein
MILIVASATLIASFLCSLFEAALYSIPMSRVELLKQQGVRGSRRLAELRENVEEPIAAILTVNTVAHTVGAAWCGALVAEEFGSSAVGIFAAVFTVLVLAITEIIPKSLGVRYATQLGPMFVVPIQIMIWSTWPVVWMARRVMKMLKGDDSAQGPSEEEVAILARMAAHHGSVSSDEYQWVQNVLALDKVTAGELRTPRTVVETLDADTPIQELVKHVERWVHSRVPLIEGDDPDKVIGLVHRREVLDRALSRPNEELLLRDMMRPIRFVPETIAATELLKIFIADRSHMVAVVDEYGGMDGVVTLEDVLESMLGAEIVDEHDEVDNMQAHAREQSQERANPVDT